MKEFKIGNTRFHLVGRYKWKNVFVQILTVLLFYSAVLLIVLFTYNRYIVRKNVEQRLEQRTMGFLEKTQESIDRELHNLSSQTMQLSKDEHIRSEMTAPNIWDSERNYNIVYQLQSVQMINDLVHEAYLYIPTDDTFFSSTGTASFAEKTADSDEVIRLLLDRCRNQGAEAGEQQFFVIGDHWYLASYSPYFYDRVLGVLIFEVNSQYLYSMIEGRNENGRDNVIWTYDGNGIPIFPAYLAYPKELTPEKLQLIGTGEGTSGEDNSSYYKVVSGQNGWQYVLRKDTDLFQMEASVLDGGLVVIILALVLFCIGFSIYLACSVYLPIHKLISIAESDEGSGETSHQNELELLEQNLSYTVMRNQEMDHFLQNIKPSMISDTFRNLLAGHEIEREKLDATFSALGTEFHTNLNYTLEMISVQSVEKEFSILECNILLRRIEQEITVFAKNRFLCSFVHMLENGHMVVVMGFSRDVSVKRLRSMQEELEPRLRNICCAYPVQLLIGASRYLMDIEELYKSFAAINQELNYKIYLQGRQGHQETSVDQEPAKSMILNAFSSLKEKVDNGEEEEARNTIDRLASELLGETQSEEERRTFAVLWWEGAMKQMIPLNLFERDELMQERERLFGVLDEKEAFAAQLRSFNSYMVDKLRQSSHKLKRRYVERARQYIEEHYSDSDLSLSSISEFLGISQSYLSTQFKKETGTNFIEYVNRYRVEQSKLLLQMTEMTVEEIGFKTGFSSAKNFIRVFKKYMDDSPGMYREKG